MKSFAARLCLGGLSLVALVCVVAWLVAPAAVSTPRFSSPMPRDAVHAAPIEADVPLREVSVPHGPPAAGADAIAPVRSLPFELQWEDARATLSAATLHASGREFALTPGADATWRATVPDPLLDDARIEGVLASGGRVVLETLQGRHVVVPSFAAELRMTLHGSVDRSWSVSVQPVVRGGIAATAEHAITARGAAARVVFGVVNFRDVFPVAPLVVVAPVGSEWHVHATCDAWSVEPGEIRLTCPGEAVLKTSAPRAAITVRAPNDTVIVLYRGDGAVLAVSERKSVVKGGREEFFVLGQGEPIPPDQPFHLIARLPAGGMQRMVFRSDAAGAADLMVVEAGARPPVRAGLGVVGDETPEQVMVRRGGVWHRCLPDSQIEDAGNREADGWRCEGRELVVASLDPLPLEILVVTGRGRVGRATESARGVVVPIEWLAGRAGELVPPGEVGADVVVLWQLEARIDEQWLATATGRGPARGIAGMAVQRLLHVPMRLVTREPGKAARIHDTPFR